MIKKIAIGAGVVVLLLLSVVGFFWVRSVFAHDNVRRALASQISSAIGQPVSIETIGAGIYPRVTIKLGGVTIGQPVRIHAQTLRLGTDLRALLSRQIVHGTVHLDGARVDCRFRRSGRGRARHPTQSRAGGRSRSFRSTRSC